LIIYTDIRFYTTDRYTIRINSLITIDGIFGDLIGVILVELFDVECWSLSTQLVV